MREIQMAKCAQCKGSGWVTKAGHSKLCVSCNGLGQMPIPVSSAKQKVNTASVGAAIPKA
jgi:DnaJ-class molecular chaperone